MRQLVGEAETKAAPRARGVVLDDEAIVDDYGASISQCVGRRSSTPASSARRTTSTGGPSSPCAEASSLSLRRRPARTELVGAARKCTHGLATPVRPHGRRLDGLGRCFVTDRRQVRSNLETAEGLENEHLTQVGGGYTPPA